MKENFQPKNHKKTDPKDTEKLLSELFQVGRLPAAKKIESDGNGIFFLDPNDPHDQEWYQDDETGKSITASLHKKTPPQ